MAMALVDDKRSIQRLSFGAERELAGLCAETHRAAFLRHFLLRVEQRDDRMRRVQIELSGVRLFQLQNISSELDCGNLHSKTKAEIGNFIFAGIFHRFDFTFDAALAET